MKSLKNKLIKDANERSDPTSIFITEKLRSEIWQFSDEVMHKIDYAIKNKVLRLLKYEITKKNN
jgi:hypothetical protein